MTEQEMLEYVAKTLREPQSGECIHCRKPVGPGSDEYCAECVTQCAWGCGNPRMPGSELCEDCAEVSAEWTARHEARERREAAKAAREAQQAVWAAEGCGCASEAECKQDSWYADSKGMSKAKARKLYDELYARCAKSRRRQAEWRERQARDEAEREARRQARRAETEARWAAVTVQLRPSPLLVGLRDMVLALRHDRCPKWRFRLADDLVVQIQPRPGERRDRFHLFECIAIASADTTKEMFDTDRARRGRAYVVFGILADPETSGWRTEPTGFTSGGDVIMARLAELLPKLDVIDPRRMFSAHCLCCGKALTDPASMARYIGPECAGTASLDAGLITPKPATV